ncbi:MAG: 16S rRNA (guanine(966)-N(2))-methyltransferase RsmD [bacterium]
MRIIAGKYKSRSLLAPKGDTTRPTSDRARESLFNVLQNWIDFDGINVLDLFAGSGAFAFEALSRGSNSVTLVEQNRKVIETINANAKILEVGSDLQVIQKDVYVWLAQRANPISPTSEYNLIFADPPYDDPRTLTDLPKTLFSGRLLTSDSIVIIEHRKGSQVGIPDNALCIKELQAGEAMFTIMRSRGTDS